MTRRHWGVMRTLVLIAMLAQPSQGATRLDSTGLGWAGLGWAHNGTQALTCAPIALLRLANSLNQGQSATVLVGTQPVLKAYSTGYARGTQQLQGTIGYSWVRTGTVAYFRVLDGVVNRGGLRGAVAWAVPYRLRPVL